MGSLSVGGGQETSEYNMERAERTMLRGIDDAHLAFGEHEGESEEREGVSICDVRKISGLVYPLPPSHIQNIATSSPFVSFLGTPPPSCANVIYREPQRSPSLFSPLQEEKFSCLFSQNPSPSQSPRAHDDDK